MRQDFTAPSYHPLGEKPARVEDLFDDHAAMRAECPVLHGEGHGGFFEVFRYEDVRAVMVDHDRFGQAWGAARRVGEARPRVPPVDYDPPEHGPWRRFFASLVTPRSARGLRPVIERAARGILDGLLPAGRCDLVAEFAVPLPLLTMAELTGLEPAEGLYVGTLVEQLLSVNQVTGAEDRVAARAELRAFGMAKVEERRRHPRNDWLTLLTTDTLDGRPLTDEEIAGCLAVAFTAGQSTTAASLGSLLWHVLDSPDVLGRLQADPDLIGPVVEESLRLEAPLHSFGRLARHDAVVAGTTIPEGSTVWLNVSSANRDRTVFAQGDEFTPSADSRRHLSFGFGIHTCVGAPLARQELAVGLEAVLATLAELRLDSDEVRREMLGGLLMRVPALPVTFTPRPRPPAAS